MKVDVGNKLTKCRQVCWRVDFFFIIIILEAIYKQGSVLDNINSVDLYLSYYYETRGTDVFDVMKISIMGCVMSFLLVQYTKQLSSHEFSD